MCDTHDVPEEQDLSWPLVSEIEVYGKFKQHTTSTQWRPLLRSFKTMDRISDQRFRSTTRRPEFEAHLERHSFSQSRLPMMLIAHGGAAHRDP